MSGVLFIRMLRRAELLCLLSLQLFCSTALAADKTNTVTVLASIKPLQLIAQALTDGIVDTEVLLPAGTTPHDYALKPSDLARVYKADLLLWLGAAYEPYLAKPLQMRAANDLAVMHLNEAEHAGQAGHVSAAHSHLYGDPHLWFSPQQTLAVAQSLTETLVHRDAANAARYRENLALFSAQVQASDERIKARFRAPGDIRYLVYHDAYSYFENHYGLAHMAVVTEQPNTKPGAKSLLALRRMIRQQQVTCLFTEPQADAAIVRLVTEESDVQVFSLDPMATDIEVTAQGYVQFLEQTAARFAQCDSARLKSAKQAP